MVRVRFVWNAWSTGPVTGCIVVGSWGLTSALIAAGMALLGASVPAQFVASLARGLFFASAAFLVLAMAAGLALERSSVGRARPPKVERTHALSARVPADISRRR